MLLMTDGAFVSRQSVWISPDNATHHPAAGDGFKVKEPERRLGAWVVMRSKVIIDGVEYVPVSESNPNAKQIAIALIRRYMGKFDESEWKSLANELQVYVSEDMNQPTVMETVVEILAATRSA